MKSKTRQRRRSGFTLMEILLVMAILVILASLVIVNVITVQKGAYEDAARTQIGAFKTPLSAYRMNIGSYPTATQGLNALLEPPADLRNPAKWKGPYVEDKIPVDPWGNPYQYDLPNPDRYHIWSWGADGVNGTDDDISNY